MSDSPPSLAEVQAYRADNAARKAALGPGAEMAVVRTFALPVAGADAVGVRWLVPTSAPAGVLVYLHGGGWVSGSIDTFDRLGRELARRSGWAVLMVDYAKAPERPFPAGLEDAWTAVRWAAEHAQAHLHALGTPPTRACALAVAGDSAGGNLAAVVARRARDAHIGLAGQVLVYPVTDCDLDRPSYRADPDGRAGMDAFWRLYCADAQRTHPDASPLRADSLAGVAPALVLNAERDVLNDEVTAYAERLASEGVRTHRHQIADAEHGCLSYYDTVPAAGVALDVIAAWLAAMRT